MQYPDKARKFRVSEREEDYIAGTVPTSRSGYSEIGYRAAKPREENATLAEYLLATLSSPQEVTPTHHGSDQNGP